MNNLASLSMVAATLLVTLITIVLLLSMGSNPTTNVILGVVMIIVLFAFAGFIMIRTEGKRAK
jgi:uncharacterized RDD family membrane protein YckC